MRMDRSLKRMYKSFMCFFFQNNLNIFISESETFIILYIHLHVYLISKYWYPTSCGKMNGIVELIHITTRQVKINSSLTVFGLFSLHNIYLGKLSAKDILARLHFSSEELLLHPGVGVHVSVRVHI